MSLLLLQNVASSIFNYVGMGVGFYFRQELDFLPEDKFRLLVVETDFFNTFDVVLFVGDLINHAVACAYDLPHFELLVQIFVAAHELNYFIAHYMKNLTL